MNFISYCQRNLTHKTMKEILGTPENNRAFDIWGTPICKECKILMENKYGKQGQRWGVNI